MNMSDHISHLGSIWYDAEALEVPYFPDQFFGLDFFCLCRILQQASSSEQSQGAVNFVQHFT